MENTVTSSDMGMMGMGKCDMDIMEDTTVTEVIMGIMEVAVAAEVDMDMDGVGQRKSITDGDGLLKDTKDGDGKNLL